MEYKVVFDLVRGEPFTMWTMARDPDTARSAVRKRRRGTPTRLTRRVQDDKF